MGLEFQFHKTERALEVDGGDGGTTVQALNAAEPYPSEDGAFYATCMLAQFLKNVSCECVPPLDYVLGIERTVKTSSLYSMGPLCGIQFCRADARVQPPAVKIPDAQDT